MKFLKKIETFNQFISFHIFAFAGWVSLYIDIYIKCGNIKSGDAGFAIFSFLIILFLFILAFTIFLLERAFYFKIKNKFLVENKILKILRYLGAIYGLIDLGFVLGIIIIGFCNLL